MPRSRSHESMPATLGLLRASGYRERSVKDEIRENLRRRLAEGGPLFPGILGYDRTVVPQITNALLARHDFILLGLRGQAKTRILRQLVDLLDDWLPVIRGSDVNESPFAPFTARSLDLLAERGDDLEIDWVPRSARYQEKLATPDVTIADLIGDVDPLKAARDRLSLSSQEAILYGILPRTNRGIFAINELPDLQPRIQVGLLNILEEKDIQIRGFPVRFPMDLLLVFSANPEDYTNRGSIITPLKDRIDSQIITHYPHDLETAAAITAQEAWVDRDDVQTQLPPVVREIVEEISFQARGSEMVDQSSGVSARLSIAALESVVSSMERRAIATNEPMWPRIVDLEAAIPAITGKIELVYEGEQEGVLGVARNLVGAAVKAVFMRTFPDAYASDPGSAAQRGNRPGSRGHYEARTEKARAVSGGDQEGDGNEGAEDRWYKPVLDWFATKHRVEIGELTTESEHRGALGKVPGLVEVAREFGQPDGLAEEALWMELVLEGLAQRSLVGKEDAVTGALYLDMLGSMFDELGG